nr:hypothetical protein [Mesorhizobium sp. LNHC220B00]
MINSSKMAVAANDQCRWRLLSLPPLLGAGEWHGPAFTLGAVSRSGTASPAQVFPSFNGKNRIDEFYHMPRGFLSRMKESSIDYPASLQSFENNVWLPWCKPRPWPSLRGGESQAMHQGSIRFALDQTAAARVHVGVFSRLLATSRAHMPPAYV